MFVSGGGYLKPLCGLFGYMSNPPKIVFPGEHLSVEEEYAPGPNTYADEDGNVVASSTGNVAFDENAREVKVQTTTPAGQGIEVGTIIVGRVSLVKDAVAILSIGYAEKNGERRMIHDSTAVLGVARVSREFIRSLKDYFKVGDFVRGRVTGVTPYSIEVSTNEKGLGVIASRDEIVRHTIAGNEVFSEPSRRKWSE